MVENNLSFSVSKGSILVHSFAQDETRGELALALLQAVLAECRSDLDGKTGWISYLDGPPPHDIFCHSDLRFSTTCILGRKPCFLPFPCPHSLAWPEIGLQDADGLIRGFLSAEASYTSEKIFWIGANTHPTRALLARLAADKPHIIDAEIMDWNRSDPNRLKSMTRQVSLADHRNFKYLIDCPGYGYSGRLKWLLATGRPVFVVARDIVEYWHGDLIPWVHFVPVKDDLSDLIDGYHRLESDESLYESIGSNARKFARDNLLLDIQVRQAAEAIDRLLAPT